MTMYIRLRRSAPAFLTASSKVDFINRDRPGASGKVGKEETFIIELFHKASPEVDFEEHISVYDEILE